MSSTPNQSYLVKQMQAVDAACFEATVHEISNSADWIVGAWDNVGGALQTQSAWRIDNQTFPLRPGRGASVTASNARWDPSLSKMNYGPKRLAQSVNVQVDAKTKIIKAGVDERVSYSEAVSRTNSFSTSVTEGLTLDMTTSSETTISGSYAGISAEEKLSLSFGVSKSKEESKDQSEEGTQEESLTIEFDATAGNNYLVTVTKEHSVSYQDFSIVGVMDWDWHIDYGPNRNGRMGSAYPENGKVDVIGFAGFEQYIDGFDTNHPEIQGIRNRFYSRTKNGINHIMDSSHRHLSVSGTNQESLESNIDYSVEPLGDSIPDNLAHLPVVNSESLGVVDSHTN